MQKVTTNQLPRGIRNNNPLNIRKSAQPWQGQTGNDGKFCIFESMEMGYRAAFRVLNTYNRKHNIYSVREIIYRWAPPRDHNKTRAYIERVCREAGLRETDIIVADTIDVEQQENVKQLVQAIAYGDDASITKAPGVGKKTAQRVVIDLKDRVKIFETLASDISAPQPEKGSNRDAAAKALMALGFSRTEAMEAMASVPDGDYSTEEYVRLALRARNQR